MILMEYNTPQVVPNVFSTKETAMTVGKMLVLTFFGVLLAVTVAKKDFWWPTAAEAARSIATSLTTPDPDHA